MADPVPQRRTQVERTAATTAKLIDATISCIVDVGYAKSTTREISARAGVSQGGLFRHFPTRRELVVASVAKLHEAQLATIRAAVTDDDPLAPIRALQCASGQSAASVWTEVLMAARTDPELRDDLRPLVDAQRRAFREAAERIPAFARLTEESKLVWLAIARDVFTAVALWRDLVVRPDLDEPKLAALIELLELLGRTHDP